MRTGKTILRVIRKYLPDYDMSRSDNGPSLAYSLTERYIRRDSCFRYLLNQPGVYDFFKGSTGIFWSRKIIVKKIEKGCKRNLPKPTPDS